MNGGLDKVSYIIKRQGLGLVIIIVHEVLAWKICCKSTQVHHL